MSTTHPARADGFGRVDLATFRHTDKWFTVTAD